MTLLQLAGFFCMTLVALIQTRRLRDVQFTSRMYENMYEGMRLTMSYFRQEVKELTEYVRGLNNQKEE